MNPYLTRLREQYDGLRSSIEGLQTRAAEENRDLDEAELRSVTEQGENARSLAEQIERLTVIEERNRQVDQAAERVLVSSPGRTSNTAAVDRDPGHYRSEREGGEFSFFGDMYKARTGDDDAARRIGEHNRALTTGSHGVGIVPPRWLTQEYAALASQGRVLANAVRNIPLGNDPRPLTLPKQTVGAAVGEQASENDAVTNTDAFDTDVDTVTPKAVAGYQEVSRQMLDMSSPAIDQLIYGDLMADYNTKIETKVGSAIVTAAGSAVTTFATEAAFIVDEAAHSAVVDTAMAVWQARKLPADLLVMRIRRWGSFKKLYDTTGRPLIPAGSGGPMNVIGVGNVAAAGQIEELAVIATEGLGTTAYPESIVAQRAADVLLFESNVMRFRYEEVVGPQSVRLGVWGYTACLVRYAGSSGKRIIVTAAT